MDLNDIRAEIDALDQQIRDLLMKRMDCSYQVAQAKQAAGSTDIYRADREKAILDALGADVPPERRAEYLAVVRKVMEASRMYQYGLIYEWNDGLFAGIEGSGLCSEPSSCVKVRLTRADQPNAMSPILSMVGDYGFNMEQMALVGIADGVVTFDLTIRGNVTDEYMRCLLFQLSKESAGFRITEVTPL